jgi:hypothetical protein
MGMIRDTGRTQLWAELGLTDLLSPAAVGASFEGLANFLISGVDGTHVPSRATVRSDGIRETD